VGLADGRGVAVKITDGSERARVVVTTAVLRRLGVGGDDPRIGALLDELDARTVVRGHGDVVGVVRAVGVA
jgi:L-asparaginase II